MHELDNSSQAWTTCSTGRRNERLQAAKEADHSVPALSAAHLHQPWCRHRQACATAVVWSPHLQEFAHVHVFMVPVLPQFASSNLMLIHKINFFLFCVDANWLYQVAASARLQLWL
jgi:hypothetical protein